MSVVKAHYIAVRRNDAGVLLILPVKLAISDRSEEVPLSLIRPTFGVTQNPVQLSGVIIDVHNSIDVAAGKGDGICIGIVPQRIAVEPVFRRPTAGFALAGDQKIAEIPSAQHFAGIAIQ